MSQTSKKDQPATNPSGEQLRMLPGSVPGVGSMGVPTTSTGPSLDLGDLRKTAEVATPGPWITQEAGGEPGYWWVWQESKLPNYGGVAEVAGRDPGAICYPEISGGHGDGEQERLDATHIATFDPETVLALLSSLEQAERNADTYQTLYEQRAETLEQAEQAVQRVREVASEYRPSIPEEVLHEVMKDLLRALDGDARRLADQGLGDNHARTTKNGGAS